MQIELMLTFVPMGENMRGGYNVVKLPLEINSVVRWPQEPFTIGGPGALHISVSCIGALSPDEKKELEQLREFKQMAVKKLRQLRRECRV